jgi:hypothetical protein
MVASKRQIYRNSICELGQLDQSSVAAPTLFFIVERRSRSPDAMTCSMRYCLAAVISLRAPLKDETAQLHY